MLEFQDPKELKFDQENVLIIDALKIIEELGCINGSLFVSHVQNAIIGHGAFLYSSQRFMFANKLQLPESLEPELTIMRTCEALVTWDHVLLAEIEVFNHMKSNMLSNLPEL